MTKTYCPKRSANGACTTCHNGSWGSAQRKQRFAIAVATLSNMGGTQGDLFRCPVTGAWYPVGAVPVEVDRPRAGECYTQGNFVITTRDGNQARNDHGDPNAEWTARYAASVAQAAATVSVPSATECDRIWNEWHPTVRHNTVTICDGWW